MDEKRSVWQKCRRIFSDYIGLNLLDGVIVGLINALFLWAMGMPHILPVSVIAGAANMIPTFGPVLGAVAGAILVVLEKPVNALWFLLFTAALQLLDSYLIKPKLFGNTLGVPSLAVVLATLIGGHFFGLLGILFAVPAAAVAFMLWREWRKPRAGEDPDPGSDDREDSPGGS